ncbi:hypothetical protein CO051_00615 [Candidatus Roizmanbacteria bacterium CG_4_9_14_0_2_um_filter_39_13]|uniref:Uncharacterized protein n=1 Tax=Candidatus Roizmanbacteria bacterium CG_4_9_14_0_2_um_filter_39_13 TaxID=1974839 RepID=A0A2M8F3W6_9BACT|nr:MAG: hypothetical protein COY15_03770 [Candidatus Roizmanbacteria bacterium CG_4_10_14_0_2_um_filter_39_12]PJC33978.1 MAG: hypothetical protein CO051_00615 [Candidatus Roizmanbacteria bacterium CG_4_9_14_0_2_um_filter_39_13]
MNYPSASSGVSVIPAPCPQCFRIRDAGGKAGIQTGSVPVKTGIESGMTRQAAGNQTLKGIEENIASGGNDTGFHKLENLAVIPHNNTIWHS